MKNEVELCRLTNLINITKLELEQKEKAIQETKAISNDDLMSDPLQKRITDMNRSIQEKDSVIEQLEILLKRKDNEEARSKMDDLTNGQNRKL